MSDKLYFLLDRDNPWGTTGDLCINGMVLSGRVDGIMQLHRAGPRCPPLSLPKLTTVVVTDQFRRLIEQDFESTFAFKPVHKSHVARIPWHEWQPDDQIALPFNGGDDIEGIIDRAPHDEAASQEMGPLWEIDLVSLEICRTVRWGKAWEYDVILLGQATPDLPIFNGRKIGQPLGFGFTICTEQMKDWLTAQAVPFIRFEPVQVDWEPSNFE